MSSLVTNQEEEAKEYQPRFRDLYATVIFFAVVIILRLWWLQIIQGEELRAYSDRNRIKETKIPAPRGLVLDREGRILVDNLEGWQAAISPQHAKQLKSTADAMAPILGMPAKSIETLVTKSRMMNGPFRPVPIKDNLSFDEIRELRQIMPEHPGLNISTTIVRFYPLGENGAQLFGYVAEISKREIDKLNRKSVKQYEQGDIIGKSGLEETWEQTLFGENGLSFVEVDARGRLAESRSQSKEILGIEDKTAVPGDNLVLTIDQDIQVAAYKAMHRDDKIGNRIGGVVAMKSNGEVLAWVNTPSYDPNLFAKGISQDLWGQLINDPFKPLRNKVIQDHYSPGSTFKPFVALSALQEGIIKAGSLVFSPGKLKFGNRYYHDHSKNGYGYISLLQAIEHSSNVFFYKMGMQLGIEKYSKYARLLGVGERTGVLLSNEEPGRMPTKEWKLKAFGEEWQPGENLSNAIGQGFVLTTALQMAVAYNSIALEGLVYRPFLVWRIVSPQDEIRREFGPELIRDASNPSNPEGFIEKAHFRTVKEGMRRVANGAGGTARWWKVPGVEMAGKTGTSQVMSFSASAIYDRCEFRPIKQRHHGWYIAWAPAQNPEITVAVLAEHSCAGNMGGAPVVRDVMQAYFEKYHPQLIAAALAKAKAKVPPPPPKLQPEETLDEPPESTPAESTPTGGTEEVIE